ncbi:hypothetical protein ACWEGE_19540 [Amycolatopsis sp. NPDC004747]
MSQFQVHLSIETAAAVVGGLSPLLATLGVAAGPANALQVDAPATAPAPAHNETPADIINSRFEHSAKVSHLGQQSSRLQ